MDQRPKYKGQITKLLKGNIGAYLCGVILGSDFLNVM